MVVTQLAGPEPVQELVEYLERLLAMAKTGELRGVAFSGSALGQDVHYGYKAGDGCKTSHLVYGLELVKVELLKL